MERQMEIDKALQLIRDVPDFPQPGILFKDITPLLADGQALAKIISEMTGLAQSFTHVIGVEARGFILGSAIALEAGVGFIPIRKAGKLPYQTLSRSYGLEYGVDVIEIHEDALTRGDRALVIDDVLATGGTLLASLDLITELGAEVDSIVVLYEIRALEGRARILEKYPSISIKALVSE